MPATTLFPGDLEADHEQGFDPMNVPLVVVPWFKFGTRRLYVNTQDGQQVGWVDLKTGDRFVTMPALAEAFDVAATQAEAGHTADAYCPRRALSEAIERALAAGVASPDLHRSISEDGTDAGLHEPAPIVRRALSGDDAYSSWEIAAPGQRLIEQESDAV